MKLRDILIVEANSEDRILFILFFLLCFFSGSGQQLDSYIQIAEENNPEIQAFNLRYEIAEEKMKEVNSYPDTEFGFGYFVSEPETRTGLRKQDFLLGRCYHGLERSPPARIMRVRWQTPNMWR